MKLSLAEYLSMQKKLKEAVDLIYAIEHEAWQKATEHNRQGNKVEADFLYQMSTDLQNGHFGKYLEPPQSEWMGGPTSGPGSEHTKTYLRESHIFPGRHRHYTAAEVQEAKDLGLLTGGPDLTGPKE